MQTVEYDLVTDSEVTTSIDNALTWSNGTTFGTSGYYNYNQYFIYVGLNGASRSYTGTNKWTVLGTLPVGYRPPYNYFGRTNRTGYYLSVQANGTVQVYNENNTTTTTLTGGVVLPRI